MSIVDQHRAIDSIVDDARGAINAPGGRRVYNLDTGADRCSSIIAHRWVRTRVVNAPQFAARGHRTTDRFKVDRVVHEAGEMLHRHNRVQNVLESETLPRQRPASASSRRRPPMPDHRPRLNSVRPDGSTASTSKRPHRRASAEGMPVRVESARIAE